MTTCTLSSIPSPLGFDTLVGSLQDAKPQLSVRFLFNQETIKILPILEDILTKVYQPWVNRGGNESGRPAPETRSYSSLDTIMTVHEQFSKFEAQLPPILSWNNPTALDGVAPEDFLILMAQRHTLHSKWVTVNCRGEKTLTMFRFNYLRIMLLRPMLTQLSLNERSNADSKNPSSTRTQPLLSNEGLHTAFTVDCAKSCVEAALTILSLVHGAFLMKVQTPWWWDTLCESQLRRTNAREINSFQMPVLPAPFYSSLRLVHH